MKAAAIISIFIFSLAVSFQSFALVPDLIPVQGTLSDANDVPIDGPADITFHIFDAPSAGNVLYTSVYNSLTSQVNITQGAFTVYLGELDTYPLYFGDLSDSAELWLQITVNGEVMESRIRMGTVPFAQEAKTCNQVGDFFPEDIQPALGVACEEGTFLRGWDAASDSPICDADMISATNSASPNWEEMINIPAGFSDNSDDGFTTEAELTALLNDNYLGNSIGTVTSENIANGTILADDVNSSMVQVRGTTTSCESGQFVQGIGEDGNVTCATDMDSQSTYTAGNGISISGTTISNDEAWVETQAVEAGTAAGFRSFGTPIENIELTSDMTPGANGLISQTVNPSPLCIITGATSNARGATTDEMQGCSMAVGPAGTMWILQLKPAPDVTTRCLFTCFAATAK